MKNVRLLLLTALLAGLSALPSTAGGALTPDEIIQRFAANEDQVRDVWRQYAYDQKLVIEVIGRSGDARERRVIEMEVYFTTDGKRQSRIVSDRGELRSIGLTQQDLDDALHLQPFSLTSEEIPNYEIKYRGKEQVDELMTHVFEVKPRDMEKDKRYFKGRIWVDDVDFQIVRTIGKAVPDYADNKFPEFETLRQEIEDGVWFPVWIHADDYLDFGGFFRRGQRVHIREWITLDNFQKFEVSTKIIIPPTVPDGQDN
ncbi:MAG TPA: hypothetical protein VLV83_19850 [Acidobacteriota bacterium]|nr:hypothetical protein [Acidobacteriota bacterium]